MRSKGVEVADVLAEHRLQMSLSEDDDVIETLLTHAAEKAFARGLHERRMNGCLDADTNARALGDSVGVCAKLGVATTDNELGTFAERREQELIRSKSHRGLLS